MNNQEILFNSGYQLCQSIKTSYPTTGASCQIGGAALTLWGVYQLVDLSNLTWTGTVQDSCECVISWKSSGYSGTAQTIHARIFQLDDASSFTNKCRQISSDLTWTGVAANYITDVVVTNTLTPLSTPITLDVDLNTSKLFIILLYSESTASMTDTTMKWVWGGIVIQPEIEIRPYQSANVITTPLERYAIYDIYRNSYSNFISQITRQDPYGTVTNIGNSSTNPVTDLLNPASIGNYAYMAGFGSPTYTGYTCIEAVYVTDRPVTKFAYSGTVYDSNQTFSVPYNNTPTIRLDAQGATYSEVNTVKYAINSGNVIEVTNHTSITLPSITSTTICTITSSTSGLTGNTLIVTFEPQSQYTATLVAAAASDFGTVTISYSNISHDGDLYGYLIQKDGNNTVVLDTQDNPVVLTTLSEDGSGSCTVNIADLTSGTSDISLSDNTENKFEFHFYATPDNTSLQIGAISYTLTYNTPVPTFYNQHGNSNIPTSNETKICRKLRCNIPIGTSGINSQDWNWFLQSNQTANISTSYTPVTNPTNCIIDATLTSLPSAGSTVNFNFSGLLTQQSLCISPSHQVYLTYSFSTSKIEIPQPAITNIALLVGSSTTMDFFSAQDSTSLTFTAPSSINTNNYFKMTDSSDNTYYLPWALRRSGGQLTSGTLQHPNFTWSTIKNNLTATRTNQFGTKTNFGMTIRFINQFGEPFDFPVTFYINYNAAPRSAAISQSSSSIASGSDKVVTYSWSPTTYETYTIQTYANNNLVNSSTVSSDVTGNTKQVTFQFTFSGSSVDIYGVITGGTSQTSVTTSTITATASYHNDPTIVFNSITYDKNSGVLSYTYTLSDWGVPISGSPPTYPTIGVALTDGTHGPTTLAAPTSGGSLPQVISGTIDIHTWNLSANTEIWLAISSTFNQVTKTSTSNSQTIILSAPPTVAYRPNQIGINTSNPRSSSAVDIHTIAGKPNITLVSSSGVITINPANGTIDFEFLS